MESSVTQGVKVIVKTNYQPYYSNPRQLNYVFSYEVTIENNSDQTIQLLNRHWMIIDANSHKREVNGEGVIGVKPIIEPGEKHQYISGCNLNTPIGKMFGSYEMERQLDGKKFLVTIPEFQLMAPFLQN